MISRDLEFNLCVGQKTQPNANILRDRYLSLTCNLHSKTPTGKYIHPWKPPSASQRS